VELRDALARVLRDPTLTLVYWLPKLESWADLDGRPVALADLAAGRTTTMIDSAEGHVVALLHHPALDDERELLEAVAAAAAIALENARLQVELRARLDDLKRSRARLVEAGDAERRRLERDLHDGAQQRMVGIALQLRLVHGQIRRNPEEAEQLVMTASNELARSLSELRELARGIHPAVLEHGLSAALDALAARSAVPTTVSFEAPGRLPERVEFAAYFVASEALANVAKYARATTATLRVWRAGPMAIIEIADDGIGGADDAAGTGLRGLADRVEALDGRLRVVSPPGAGTIVTAEMPCGS
jgi:signal transduction histidine kinase